MIDRLAYWAVVAMLVLSAVLVLGFLINMPDNLQHPDITACEDAGGIYMDASRTCAFPPETKP